MLCGIDQECLYDALATRDLAIGANTMVTGESLQDNAEALGKLSQLGINISHNLPLPASLHVGDYKMCITGSYTVFTSHLPCVYS